MAYMVINVEQGTQEWLDIRSQYVTGTDLAVLDGCSPFVASQQELLQIKRGEKEVFVSEAMQQGSEYEDLAMHYLIQKTGIVFEPAVVLDQQQSILASLDGADLTFDAHAEIKIPLKGKDSDLWKQVLLGRIPRYYMLQMQAGMQVTGAKKCYFWVFDLKSRTGLPMIVERDDELISLNRHNARGFYDKYLATGSSPVDEVVYIDDPSFDEQGAEIQLLKALIKDAESRIKEIESERNQALENRPVTYRGAVIQVKQSVKKPRIDYSEMVKDLIVADPDFDAEEYRPKANPDDLSKTTSVITA